MQALLRRADVAPSSSDGPGELRQRIQAHPPRTHARSTVAVEETSDRLRELDERPVSQGLPRRVHLASLRRYAASFLARFSGADKAIRQSVAVVLEARLAGQRMD